MGLYLCVFSAGEDDEELDGVEVGSYDDFDRFRRAVARLEPEGWGSRFPVLMLHEDSDGTWSPEEAVQLRRELIVIALELGKLPPQGFPEGWQADVARQLGLTPASLRDCFIDVDGEALLDRLIGLAGLAGREGLLIWFQ
jgi:hypothetical protein